MDAYSEWVVKAKFGAENFQQAVENRHVPEGIGKRYTVEVMRNRMGVFLNKVFDDDNDLNELLDDMYCAMSFDKRQELTEYYRYVNPDMARQIFNKWWEVVE